MFATFKLDSVDRLALGFLIVGSALFLAGLLVDTRTMGDLLQTLVDEWTPGFVIDGLLLLTVNRIIRDNERRSVLAQVGSLSNDFALDAVRRVRQEGWLNDGSLRDARLRKASLSNADLSGGCLAQVDLRYSDLRGAKLAYTDLRGADLTGCNLHDADLRWADLRGACLRWSNLMGAQLEHALLEGADLAFASMDADNTGYAPTQGVVTGSHVCAAQAALLQSTFKRIERSGEVVIEQFYAHLFAARPELEKMFSGSRKRQSQKFLSSLKVIISALGQPERSIEVLEQLGRLHAGYGVQRAHYELAGRVLLETLQSFFGEEFTAELEAAWRNAFVLISSVMLHSSDEQAAS